VGDPDSDLAGLLAAGTEGLVAVHDAVAADLHAYAWFLLAPGRHAADDGPAEAVLDALLVAGETAGELAHPGLARAWLYALTRNECLRVVASRRAAVWPGAAAEVAELAGRHRLAPAEVAAVLGEAARPDADPGPATPVKAPPRWLRAELVAALGVEAAGRRAELARRAHTPTTPRASRSRSTPAGSAPARSPGPRPPPWRWRWCCS
jgi:DNA-directed RNA polymerase specialized sigma24 family protein